VAFKNYYVMAWRAGETELPQSSLTRAVISARGPRRPPSEASGYRAISGTSSMGKLLGLWLVCTLAAAVLFGKTTVAFCKKKFI
jgi:hypothetical protein